MCLISCHPEDFSVENALLQIEDLTRRNKALEDQLRLASAGREVGRRDTTSSHQEDGKCLVLGDSVIRNVGTDNSDTMVECFPGIRTEQLHRVIDNRELGSPDAIVLHVGTDDLRKTRNLDYVMGEVYGLVKTAKTKFPTSKIVLSGVLRRRDVSWRRIGELTHTTQHAQLRTGHVINYITYNFDTCPHHMRMY